MAINKRQAERSVDPGCTAASKQPRAKAASPARRRQAGARAAKAPKPAAAIAESSMRRRPSTAAKPAPVEAPPIEADARAVAAGRAEAVRPNRQREVAAADRSPSAPKPAGTRPSRSPKPSTRARLSPSHAAVPPATSRRNDHHGNHDRDVTNAADKAQALFADVNERAKAADREEHQARRGSRPSSPRAMSKRSSSPARSPPRASRRSARTPPSTAASSSRARPPRSRASPTVKSPTEFFQLQSDFVRVVVRRAASPRASKITEADAEARRRGRPADLEPLSRLPPRR